MAKEFVPSTSGNSHFLEYLKAFEPAELESDLQAIWKEVEMAQFAERLRNSLSLSTEMSSDSSNNNYQLRASKSRRIVGRGPSYYERYGQVSITIPKNMPTSYPPRGLAKHAPKDKTNQRKKQWKNAKTECTFCKNISPHYQSHSLKNSLNVITCPVLRAYTCPLCGDNAHTVRYCPLKRLKLAEEYERSKKQGTKSSQPMQLIIKPSPNRAYNSAFPLY